MVVIVVATPNKAVSTTPVMREVQKTMRFVTQILFSLSAMLE